MKNIYNQLKQLSLEEFVLSFKDKYLEYLWYSEPFVKNNPGCHYSERKQFERRVRDCLELSNIKADEIQKRKESYKNYIDEFESKLNGNEREELSVLMEAFDKLVQWQTDSSVMNSLREDILKAMANEIDPYDDILGSGYSYTYAKRMVGMSNLDMLLEELVNLRDEIVKYESYIEFGNEFQAKEEDFLNELRNSLKTLV